MPTEKLYYTDPYMSRFTATVLSAELDRTGWHIVLDKTAFYPEGGGQPGDTGKLGDIEVLDTHEREGVIYHLCPQEIKPGSVVEGEIDFARRLDFMAQHSGEHIVSGIINEAYGYDNVGFHMGAELVTIDLSGPLDWEQVQDIERRANEKVRQNLPINCNWPEAETLKTVKPPMYSPKRSREKAGNSCCYPAESKASGAGGLYPRALCGLMVLYSCTQLDSRTLAS